MIILKEPTISGVPVIWHSGYLYDGIIHLIANKYIRGSDIKGLFRYYFEAMDFRKYIMEISI